MLRADSWGNMMILKYLFVLSGCGNYAIPSMMTASRSEIAFAFSCSVFTVTHIVWMFAGPFAQAKDLHLWETFF